MCGRYACRYHHGPLAAALGASSGGGSPPRPPAHPPSADCRPTTVRSVLVATTNADTGRGLVDDAVTAAAAAADVPAVKACVSGGDFRPASSLASAPAAAGGPAAATPSTSCRWELLPARWGLLRKDGAGDATGRLLFNARSEDAATRRTWAPLLRSGRRCAAPVEWWYEWFHLPGKGGAGGGTVPYAIHMDGAGPRRDGAGGMAPPRATDVLQGGVKAEPSDVKGCPPIAASKEETPRPDPPVYLAGLYDITDTGVYSFVLLTTAATSTAWLHPRSPVLLPSASALDEWLDPATPPETAIAAAVTSSNAAVSSLSWTPMTPSLGSPTGEASTSQPEVATLVAGCRPLSSWFGRAPTGRGTAAADVGKGPTDGYKRPRTSPSTSPPQLSMSPLSSPAVLPLTSLPAAACAASLADGITPTNAATPTDAAGLSGVPIDSATPMAVARTSLPPTPVSRPETSSTASPPLLSLPSTPLATVTAAASTPTVHASPPPGTPTSATFGGSCCDGDAAAIAADGATATDAVAAADAALAAALQREEDAAAAASAGDRLRARYGLPPRRRDVPLPSSSPPARPPSLSPAKRKFGGGATGGTSPAKQPRRGGSGASLAGGQRRLDAFFARAP
ncbi:hypothetical protein MMPV_008056 [Pyropia vietnamensis]